MGSKVEWYDIQQKVFTRWCNDYLAERGMKINDLKTDLCNGLCLINLVEVLSGKSVGRYNKHPKINMQKFENLTLALNFIQAEGIKLVNIGSADIESGNMRIILGLIWTLILRFEIKGGDGKDAASSDLLEWIRSKIPEYDIKNFGKDWNDGRAVCALTNALSPGTCSDHKSRGGDDYDRAKHGIDNAYKSLGVDPLILPEEMIHKKVDKLAMMTYLAQFRNIKESEQTDASRCHAYGPGLVEGIAGEEAPFTVETPPESDQKISILVEGPNDNANVNVTDKGDGIYDVSYMPTTPGMYKVHVKLGGDHIPGSVFEVIVLESESLGGEGKIRVFFSTTSSNEKSKRDVFSLESLLTAKKVHLREDFEPWHAVDIMNRDDREAVFRKAGTRALPIVFVDDKYVGDYDKLMEMEECQKLDDLLAMKGVALVSESEHLARLKAKGDPSDYKSGAADALPSDSGAAAAPAAAAASGGGELRKFCGGCGAKASGSKFCSSCGASMAK